MDALATALADLAHTSERRSFRLCDTRLSYGLPMNLVPDELGINYGFPIIPVSYTHLAVRAGHQVPIFVLYR